MKVHEIMTGHARSVAPDTTLVEAAGLMRELDVGALPVCDGGKVAGIVTDRDMVVRGIADGGEGSWPVSRVMSGGVEAVSADDDVEHAVRIMEQRQIRRLPVLDRGQRLVGIVSLGDVATSSNPAFSGMALRDVSEPNEPGTRRRRLMQQSEPARLRRAAGSPKGPEGARRGTAGKRRQPKVTRRRAGRRSGKTAMTRGNGRRGRTRGARGTKAAAHRR